MRAAGPLAPIGNRREVDFFLRHSRLKMRLLPCSRIQRPQPFVPAGAFVLWGSGRTPVAPTHPTFNDQAVRPPRHLGGGADRVAHLAHRPNQLLGPPPRLGPQPALRRRGQGLLPRLQAVRGQPAPAHAPPPCGTTPHTARDDPQSVYNLSRPPRLPHSWDRALNAPENVLWSKSNAGDILCFDNRRVLHGRSGFEVCSHARISASRLRLLP